MPLFAKDKNKIEQESIDYLAKNTPFNAVSPGSKVRALVSLIAERENDQYNTFDYNTAVSLVYGSEGKFLDYIGDIWGLTRGVKTTASSSLAASKVKFYTDYPSFGDINSGNDIVIPSSTMIWAVKNSVKIYYSLKNNIVLDKSKNEQYVDVVAVLPGKASNISASQIKYSDFTDYTMSKNNLLNVANVANINNGTDIESDDNFRYRIINEKIHKASGNIESIKLAALSVNGVADVMAHTSAYGPGNTGLLVKSVLPAASNELIREVQDVVDKTSSYGIPVTVSAPDYLYISIHVKVAYKSGITSVDKINANDAISLVASDYINNLDIGESFSSSELASRIISSVPDISNIGSPGVKFFNNITIAKRTPYGESKSTIDNVYTPTDMQKLIFRTVTII